MSERIFDIEERYSGYLQDESRLEGRAEKIAFPRTEDEAEAVLEYARRNHCPVTVQGGRTGIVGGAVPVCGIVLNMSGLNKIQGISKREGKYYLRLQSGVLLSDLQEQLETGRFDTAGWSETSIEILGQMKREGRFQFPPDPTETTATLGGMLATNAEGISGHYYGRTADYVEGIALLTAAGERWEIRRGEWIAKEEGLRLPNGRLLPAFSGEESGQYPLLIKPGQDLIDVIAGSEGMLGVVTSMEVRLERRPDEIWGVLFFFGEENAACRFLKRLQSAGGKASVTAGEFFDRAALDMVEDMKGRMTKLKVIPDIPQERQAAVYVELIAQEEADAEEVLTELLEAFDEMGGREEDTWAASGRDEMEKFRLLRHAVPEGINHCVDAIRRDFPKFCKMGTDFSLKEEIDVLLSLYRNEAKKDGIPCVIFGHGLDGHFHVNLLPDTAEAFERAGKLLEYWAERIAAKGGCLAAENGIGKIKAGLIGRHLSEDACKAMADVRAVLDEDGLLNRGNMMMRQGE